MHELEDPKVIGTSPGRKQATDVCWFDGDDRH